jgi:hypothetical protein
MRRKNRKGGFVHNPIKLRPYAAMLLVTRRGIRYQKKPWLSRAGAFCVGIQKE